MYICGKDGNWKRWTSDSTDEQSDSQSGGNKCNSGKYMCLNQVFVRIGQYVKYYTQTYMFLLATRQVFLEEDSYSTGVPGPSFQFLVASELLIYFCDFVCIIWLFMFFVVFVCFPFLVFVPGLHSFKFR